VGDNEGRLWLGGIIWVGSCRKKGMGLSQVLRSKAAFKNRALIVECEGDGPKEGWGKETGRSLLWKLMHELGGGKGEKKSLVDPGLGDFVNTGGKRH